MLTCQALDEDRVGFAMIVGQLRGSLESGSEE